MHAPSTLTGRYPLSLLAIPGFRTVDRYRGWAENGREAVVSGLFSTRYLLLCILTVRENNKGQTLRVNGDMGP